MRYLILLFFLIFFGCVKEEEIISVEGRWGTPGGRNIYYYGYYTDTVLSSRKIFYSADSLQIILTDAPFKQITADFSNNTLYYDDYFMENNPITPNCAKMRIEYYNIIGSFEKIGDTLFLIENGSYRIFLDGVENTKYNNYYIGKFYKNN